MKTSWTNLSGPSPTNWKNLTHNSSALELEQGGFLKLEARGGYLLLEDARETDWIPLSTIASTEWKNAF